MALPTLKESVAWMDKCFAAKCWERSVPKMWRVVKAHIKKNVAAQTNDSPYVKVLEEDYHILNRMGGALDGCRAELAIVIEHLREESK